MVSYETQTRKQFGLLHVYGFSNVIDFSQPVSKNGIFFFVIDTAYDCGNFIWCLCPTTSLLSIPA